ncbi:MAG: TetR/AcrR family transcriptional regulator [Alphaproteobacteria bacterium]|nr:TetR/AcrR family transcriptional regulator [Alphaproteobacteria bacterium]
MPRTPATAARRNEESSRIRDAAGTIFADKGITAISARAVAKEAGVSVGKIYAYYNSLTELMQSLWQGRVQRLATTLHELAGDIDDPVERIRSILDAYVSFAHNNRDLYKGALLFVRPEGLPTPEQDDAERVPIMDLLIKAIAEGQQAGTIRDGSAVRMAQLLWAGVHGALALPINIDRYAFKERDHLTSDMVGALMGHIQTAN